MSPAAWEIVSGVSATYGIAIEMIVGRCRAHRLMRARIEIAERLRDRGYTIKQIGWVLKRDSTTVTFYLGGVKKRKPSKARWQKPHIRHFSWVEPEKTAAPVLKARPPSRFLIPYAGADMSQYIWRERPKRAA